MKERYSLAESMKLLGNIDSKTLKLWMGKAGISPIPGKDDNRRKYIAAGQLLQLADEHERSLHLDDDQAVETTVSPTAYNLLLDRVNNLYDIVSKQHVEIAALRRDLEGMPTRPPSQQQEAATPGEIAALRVQIAKLERADGQQFLGDQADELKKLRAEVNTMHEAIDTYGKLYGSLMSEQREIRKALNLKASWQTQEPAIPEKPARKRGKTT